MADKHLLAGAAVRRTRQRADLTQAAMAERLGISPSYLALIERNRRPLSASVMLQLVEAFDFDPRSLSQAEATGGVDGMKRRLADPRFDDLDVTRDEIAEWLAAAPHAAIAFARIYDAGGAAASSTGPSPAQSARREIERWRNHFADLDHAAETLADELRLSNPDLGHALSERLRQRHQIAVRILPGDVMPDHLRRFDLHARQLQLAEMLQPHSRIFQMAVQVGLLEQRELLRDLSASSGLEDEAARRLFARHLQGYFAAAVQMPYDRFIRACEATGYDLPVLQRRFGVGFEQLAHRLTTLQRVGRRGLPFFMVRVDRAGQVSKRFVGASGTLLLDGPATCPLWDLHRAFERPGEIVVQTLDLDGAGAGEGTWFTLSRTVDGVGAQGCDARFAISLGIEIGMAGQLAAARGVALDSDRAQPVGTGCIACRRVDCRQRSLPPAGETLRFAERERGITPFEFGKDEAER